MRRFLAALLFTLGFASPALAAVCGPIPALPDTTRRTEYAGIVAQTGPFNVGFQLYGDGTDYSAWLSVWVNGILQTSGSDYTVDSPSGALGTLCRPITDARVTFTGAQTGTIEIEGSRRPRRASQFNENAGVKGRDLNQAFSDMEAQLRERWDRESRLLRSPPGESLVVLPPAATRANGFLVFDNAGNPRISPSGGGSIPVIPPAVAWTNTTLAKTGAYAPVTGDCGDTITLAGAAYYTLTIGAASTFAVNCAFVVVNDDPAAGKLMTISGVTSFILWPQQTIIVYASNNGWRTTGPYRWRLPGATTFFVDPAGSDSNDGLSASRPWQHIQTAITNIQTLVDLNGGNPLIQLAFGTTGSPVTYNENFTVFGGFTGGLEVTIQGNPAAPGAAVWNGTLAIRDGTIMALNGIKFISSGSQAIECTQKVVLDLQNMEFGAVASGVHIQVDPGCKINYVGGTYVVSGAAIFHVQLSYTGIYTIAASQIISVPNALVMTDWVFMTGGMMSFGGGVTFTGTGSGAGSTCKKYDVQYGGLLLLSSVTLPCATSGTFSDTAGNRGLVAP